MSKSKSKGTSTPTTKGDVSRIQSAVARKHGGQVPKGSYVGRMQKFVAKNIGKAGYK